jgi:hypothetical protein
MKISSGWGRDGRVQAGTGSLPARVAAIAAAAPSASMVTQRSWRDHHADAARANHDNRVFCHLDSPRRRCAAPTMFCWRGPI